MMQHGACEAGLVPYCFGTVDPPTSWPPQLDDAYDSDSRGNWAGQPLSEDGYHLYYHFCQWTDAKPPRGLLLEYIPEMETLSFDNITMDIAQKVMQTLICLSG